MKRFRASLVLVAILAAPLALCAQEAAPEIRIVFFPEGGYLPADGSAPGAFEFRVAAMGESEKGPTGLISTEMILVPGHTRKVFREYGDYRFEGNVKVDEKGFLMYRIVLFRKGARIASASSSVSWKEGDARYSLEPLPH